MKISSPDKDLGFESVTDRRFGYLSVLKLDQLVIIFNQLLKKVMPNITLNFDHLELVTVGAGLRGWKEVFSNWKSQNESVFMYL